MRSIIDGPPSNHSMSELIIENSDFVVIPTTGTHTDMAQTWKIIEDLVISLGVVEEI